MRDYYKIHYTLTVEGQFCETDEFSGCASHELVFVNYPESLTGPSKSLLFYSLLRWVQTCFRTAHHSPSFSCIFCLLLDVANSKNRERTGRLLKMEVRRSGVGGGGGGGGGEVVVLGASRSLFLSRSFTLRKIERL